MHNRSEEFLRAGVLPAAIEAEWAKFRLDQTKAAKVIKAQQAKDSPPILSNMPILIMVPGMCRLSLRRPSMLLAMMVQGRQLLPPALRGQHRRPSTRRFQTKLLPQRPQRRSPG